MGARGANTFPSRNRLPYPFSLVVRPLFCFVVCWHSLPFQDKYVSGDSVNFRGSDNSHLVSPCHDGRYTLVVNKVLIPYVILPCPERINIRYVQRWRLIEDHPQDNQPDHPNEPVDANDEELNQGQADDNQPPQNNPPPITLDAMYAAIQRQDQL